MKISALIPVYNNEVSVGHVVRTLLDHSGISEVIAVDDGSDDGSFRVLSGISGLRLIRFRRNRGKGAGIAAGWSAAGYPHILTIDADISRLSAAHITELISTYRSGEWDMVLSVNEYRRNIFAAVTGQRIYRKSVMLPYTEFAADVGNGIEQVINYAHRNKKVTSVVARNTGHILKYHRHDPVTAARLYAIEGWQLLRTEWKLRSYAFAGRDGLA